MNRETLIQVFKNSYKRQVFIEHCLLPVIQEKVDELVIYDDQAVQQIPLTATDQTFATAVIKYGEFKTRDELPRTVELYEVTVNNDRQIERSRVGLSALIKKHIIGHNAVMVNFTYEKPENRSWRFSFIARDSIFQDGEMTITETNPKRYTYVFGQPDETYKTAIDRFTALANEFKMTIHKIKDAFGVEKMSKQFFDDYRDVHYAGFVDYLMRSNFYKSTFNGNDKEVRNFVKKLLGRIVFLYFLQKKGWLGAKDTAYKDGDRNFMHHFFKKAGANDAFYGTWLTRLFFDTLNQKRPNDDFEMPDGETLKVPYLNGGLFEKDASKYDYLVFPAEYFENLFDFFNQYNFTIYEDGPENQTVAVDPEMLGHIFENLLEDNKDKGAFYTPKEIVHYMTQESLIEYLHTHLPNAPKEEIDQFIKNKEHRLTNADKKQIDQKLDDIKICDPAIGSGAFPMGLLQEIFSIKERIAYDLGYKVWSPATVKENIIQNSIYGVDIESGAVDIARLRFWLSLIVDEDQPKALPNLDYKIVVGNSLVSKFEDEVIEINWDFQSKSGRFQKNMIQMRKDLVRIAQLQKDYFENKNRKEKEALKQKIRDTKLDILINQLTFNKVVFEQNNPKIVDMGFGLKDKDKKKNLEIDLKTAAFSQTLKKLEKFKKDPALRFQHFDWKLDFPKVLNPLVNESTGFDIVIANPPYLRERGNAKIFAEVNKSNFGKKWHQGKMDYWFYFLHKAIDSINNNGFICFITSRYWINNTGATKLIGRINNELYFHNVVDIGKLKVFDNVAGYHMIHLYSKCVNNEFTYKKLSNDLSDIASKNDTLNTKISTLKNKEIFVDKEIVFNKRKGFTVDTKDLSHYFLVSQGVVEAPDKVSKKMYKKINNDSYEIGQGVFVLTESEVNQLNLNEKEKNILKRYIEPGEVHKYSINIDIKKYLIYSDKGIRELIKSANGYINIKQHLDRFSPFITSSNRPYGLHRPRDKKYFDNPKILFKSMFKNNEFYYDRDSLYFGMSFSSIINKGNDDFLQNLLAILNSKFALYWFYNNGKHRGAGVDIGVKKLRSFPLAENFKKSIFMSLSQNIMLTLLKNTNIDSTVPNTHIAESFEEVVDALVFELYFPEEFAEKGIEIEKYAQAIFKPIAGLSEDEQIQAIREAYQNLRKADNPLRNQIKLMKIELKELLLPILSL